MSKKTVFLIIVIVVIVLGGLLGFFYLFINSGTHPVSDTTIPPKNIFPFSSTNSNNTNHPPSTQTATGPGTGYSNTTVPELRQISIVPTAGAIVFSHGSTTAIRYTERGTGHIYQAASDSLNQIRISNITTPKISEAIWIDNASFIIRYLDDNTSTIESYFGQVVPVKKVATSTQFTNTIETTVTGNFLPRDIDQISASPKKDSVFYTQLVDSKTSGVVSKNDGSKKIEIFNSAFKDWLPQWFKDDTVLLTTKPSNESVGYAYLLNSKTGKFDKVLSEIRGLTVLANHDGSQLLFSESNATNFGLKLYTPKNGEKQTLLLKTLPEKCVWGNKVPTDLYCANPTFTAEASYPDDWYKGKVSFSDDIWRLDTVTGRLAGLAKLKDLTHQDIDAISLSLDENDNYLIFINKNDLTLWSLKLKK